MLNQMLRHANELCWIGEIEDAIEMYTDIIGQFAADHDRLDPVFAARARAQRLMGNPRAALEDWLYLVTEARTPAALFHCGNAYAALGDVDVAAGLHEAVYNALVRDANPRLYDSDALHRYMHEVRHTAMVEAVADCRRVLEGRPDAAATQWAMGLALRTAEEWDAAVSAYQLATQMARHQQAVELGRWYRAARRLRDGLSHLGRDVLVELRFEREGVEINRHLSTGIDSSLVDRDEGQRVLEALESDGDWLPIVRDEHTVLYWRAG